MRGSVENLIANLAKLAPSCGVLSDASVLSLYGTDIFWRSDFDPVAVLLPEQETDVVIAVKAAVDLGFKVIPRGGGVSYTKGYLPNGPGAVVIDTGRMNKVLEVNVSDGYARAAAGCTWANLASAVEAAGYTTGYRGPFSGLVSTIAGAVSQNSGGFGSAGYGTVAEAVLGVSVVLADGRLLRTGSAARNAARPFSRVNGPDVTGLFVGDNGAFGVKTEVVLRLRRKPEHLGFASFGFATLEALAEAQCELARHECVSSSFGFDRLKGDLATRSMRVKDGAETLLNVARSGRSVVSGLAAAAKVAISGVGFLTDHAYTLHLSIEGDSASGLETREGKVRAICARQGGRELPNSVPLALHAKPFGPLRGMVGPDGERWVPVHGLFPLSCASDVVAHWQAFMATYTKELAEHDIRISLLSMTVGYEFFLEPAFYWKDGLYPIHSVALGDSFVTSWRDRAVDLAARETVARLRSEIQAMFAQLGGVSWQVARDYPYRENLDPGFFRALADIKSALDPSHAINPGALGIA